MRYLDGHGNYTTTWTATGITRLRGRADGGAVLGWGICGNCRHTRYMRRHLTPCDPWNGWGQVAKEAST